VEGYAQTAESLKKGTLAAWNAPDNGAVVCGRAIEQAAQELARAAGIFMRILLQGIVAYPAEECCLGIDPTSYEL
jgi:hypothetical protein